MIHVFHGFLGSPSDFSYLAGHNVHLHSLRDVEISLLKKEISPEDILIGYSMGGRVALELAHAVNFNLKKIVILAAHPGLDNEEERRERIKWENEVVKKMQEGAKEFMNYWNGLPLFNYDFPLETKDDLREDIQLFEKHRLSSQQNYLSLIKGHKDKVLWIVGKFDDKYRELAEKSLSSAGIRTITMEAGHRLFQRSQELITILKEEKIL